MDNEKVKLLSWWAMIRWFLVVVLFSIGLLHISFRETFIQSIVFFLVFTGIVALNLMFQLQSRAKKKWVVAFQVVLDILFATMIVHITGGLTSFFVWAYLIGVITAALTTPQNGGLFAGLTGSFSLLILILLYRNGVLTPTESSGMDIAGSTVYILSYTGLFCGVALIANYLSDQLSQQKNVKIELEELNYKLDACIAEKKQYEELVPVLRDIARMDHDINTPLCVITLSLGRVKRYAREYQIEGLDKSNNEITEAVNKVSLILLRLQALKSHPLLDYQNSASRMNAMGANIPPTNQQINSIKAEDITSIEGQTTNLMDEVKHKVGKEENTEEGNK